MARATAVELHNQTLLLEASLSASNIRAGLTALRKFSFLDKGKFYAAMFSLTIGIERLLKLIVVLDCIASQGVPPTNEYLKQKIGHQISALYNRAFEIHDRRGLALGDGLRGDPLVQAIVDALTEFAKHSRYYNLDLISGASRSTDREPLAQWTEDVSNVILQRHFRETRRTRAVMSFASRMANADGVLVSHTDEFGRSITDTVTLATAEVRVGAKQRWSVWYVFNIVDFGVQMLHEMCHALRPVPSLHELYHGLWLQEKRAVLRRKNWDLD